MNYKELLKGIAYVSLSCLFMQTLSGCDPKGGSPEQSAAETASKTAQVEEAAKGLGEKDNSSSFSQADAEANLTFAKDQYLKMLGHVDAKKHLHFAKDCSKADAVCFPRAYEDGEIYMERLTKWTNGFWPGIFWKLLASEELIGEFTDEERSTMVRSAEFYTDALFSEAHRKTTHDLGFLLYDSFGEALEYKGLDDEKRKRYLQALKDGRNSLATRYSAEKGLIKSWDWVPQLSVSRKTEDGMVNTELPLKSPWEYPVIVDNMMNLEFLLTSDNKEHHDIAYAHAAKTKEHHYHYLADDPNKERPIAYHVFDYGTMRPGNWQGVGNISAWARGQGWSFYGFVTIAEFMKSSGVKMADMPDFQAFSKTLYGTLEHLLQDDPVPMWDFLADEENAVDRAENMSEDTAVYSHILTLCEHLIPRETLPYVGYRPIMIDKDLVTQSTFDTLKTYQSASGESMVVNGRIAPCGTKPYDLSRRAIPKDTSAAALMAAALYRFAQFTDDKTDREKYVALADRIMADITKNYRTDRNKGKTYELGFIMDEATGNLPNASEINVPIVYADFYFIEANIRKLQLESER